ncbi:MAG: Crp/Fnr family transcriptional regulator [Mariprofundaceae bacterium]|nr:Crp/Fnr family transcriptional regulator [Mariprofundaceae bacterium]
MLINILQQASLFSELNLHELQSIAAILKIKREPKQTLIVEEGEKGDRLFIILKGSVKVSYYTKDGREVILSILEQGEMFGELSLLDEQPRSATVSTLESTELAMIRRADFQKLMLENSHIMLKIMNEIVSRLRRTSQVLERISTMDVPHRLYVYLLDRCKDAGIQNKTGLCVIKIPTHQIIADQLSTSRETISRAISSLKNKKVLIAEKKRGEIAVDIISLETLRMKLD